MKITKQQLKQIIKEELSRVLSESGAPHSKLRDAWAFLPESEKRKISKIVAKGKIEDFIKAVAYEGCFDPYDAELNENCYEEIMEHGYQLGARTVLDALKAYK